MTYEKALEAKKFIRSKYDRKLKIAIVLGSGLGVFGDEIKNPVKIPYEKIPHFVRSTVTGHAGQLILGEIEDISVAVQQGRFHYYEGYCMEQVTFPMRVFGLLGIRKTIITNAAGSIITSLKKGSLMLICDHINMMGTSPLRGANDDRFGPRFPDMTEVYDKRLQEIAIEEAKTIVKKKLAKGLNGNLKSFLRRGVYCGLSGPSYETPTEIRMLRMLGVTAVGMSTVPEAIAAKHQGMKILGISCITNLAAGITNKPIDHDEVMETGKKIASVFTELLRKIIRRIG